MAPSALAQYMKDTTKEHSWSRSVGVAEVLDTWSQRADAQMIAPPVVCVMYVYYCRTYETACVLTASLSSGRCLHSGWTYSMD